MCSRISVCFRNYSLQSKSINFYTTPIYYANANPHIGHLYSSVIADAFCRWQRILNKTSKIKFSTGTDEHGSKIQQAASTNHTSVSNYCNIISSRYKKLADTFNIGYTHFIRTSNEEHKRTVQTFWNALHTNGCIYLSDYEGWYCMSDECFLSESQLEESVGVDGQKIIVSSESGHPVEWTSEKNYMFKLSSFQEDLKHWVNINENLVRPKKFQKILLDMICNDAVPDISVSRPSSRVHWGVRVPSDEEQTIYVWLDALVNYLTVAGYAQDEEEFRRTWPPDVQVIGKDILKFHGIYWPAFLMAANLEPPKSILCHSHWIVEGEKMSKSKNNVVCPFERAETYTSDGLRYFLLREGVAHSDGNYSDTKVVRILNSELSDTLGNLLSRCSGATLNPLQIFPSIEAAALNAVTSLDVTKKLIENVTTLPGVCQRHYEDLNFYKVADAVIATLHSANLFFQTLKPWELKKNPDSIKELNVVLHLTMETLRVSAILLQPLIPNISSRLLDKLSVANDERYFSDLNNFSWTNANFKERKLGSQMHVLFKRILTEDAKKGKVNKA